MGVNINSSGFFVTRLDISGNIHLLGTGMAACHFTHLQESQPLLLSRDDFVVRNPLFRESIYGRIDSYLGGWKSNAVFLGPAGKYKAFREDFASVQKYTQEMCLGFIDAGLSQWMWDILYNNIRGQNQTYFVGYHLDPMVRRCCSRPLGLGVLYCQAHAVRKWLARCVDQR
jgi:hypothetical protein